MLEAASVPGRKQELATLLPPPLQSPAVAVEILVIQAFSGGALMRWSCVLIALSLCGSAVLAKSEDWPKWLGPNGNGISTEAIASKWPEDGPKKIWEQKVGLGYSSPIGFDGKVYLFSQNNKDDVLTAFDAETGKPLWSQSYTVKIPADQPQAKNEDTGLPLPLATPTIHNGRIYTYGGGGDLVCRKLEDGSEIWHLNVLKATGEKILPWDEASAPLVTDKLVYVQAGKGGPTAVAVDAETGKIAWQSEAKTVAGYGAPLLVDVDGTAQLIVFGNTVLYGMNADNGKTIWSEPWVNKYEMNATIPLYFDHHLFVSSTEFGSMMFKLSPTGATKEWPKVLKDLELAYQPPILDRGYLYANSKGTLKCMRWPDGKIMWENKLRLNDGGTLVRDGDLLIAMSERGKLSLVKATPESAKVISQVPLFDFLKTWSTPLIYHGKLYAMGKDTLVCLDISGK
jgi:outer membrane protein assembly factor BamB